jgi:hypothetical protein
MGKECTFIFVYSCEIYSLVMVQFTCRYDSILQAVATYSNAVMK